MEENKIVQPVFNFVTVRNAKKIDSGSLTGRVISAPDNLDSELYNSLLGIAGQTGAPPADVLKQLREVTDRFRVSGKLFRSEEQLKSRFDERLVSFAEWLNANEASLTREIVVSKADASSMELTLEQTSMLWENLIYYSILGSANSVTQLILLLLKATNFFEFYRDEKFFYDDTSLQQLAQAEVILPGKIFPLPSVLQPVNEQPAPVPMPDVEGIRQQADRYQNALHELQDFYQRKKEETRNKTNQGSYWPSNPESTENLKQDNSLSPDRIDDFSVLSADTQSILQEVKAKTEFSISFIGDLLQKKIDRFTRELWENVTLNKPVLNLGGALWVLDNEKPNEQSKVPEQVLPTIPDDYDGFYFNDGRCHIRPLGVADFRRVEQELCCYKPGEVAHIENILQGEYKERATRRLRRTEDTITEASERTTETEKDSVTTDRYELQKETSKTIEKDTAFELGVSVAGGFGPVSVHINSNFSTSSSTTQSDKQAVNYAKEVTERSLQKVIENIKEERVSKIIEEFEENNKHGLDNRSGAKHVVGLYRWADKVYKAQVVNYGKRLMFEFMVPEPGAFHLYAMSKPAAQTGITMEEPVDPRSAAAAAIVGQSFRKHTDITASNYALLAAQYGAQVEAPPTEFKTVERSYSRDNLNPDPAGPHFTHNFNDLKVPEGYNPIRATVLTGCDAWESGEGLRRWITVYVGNEQAYANWQNKNTPKVLDLVLPNELETLPVSIAGLTRFYMVHVNVVCERSKETFETWQIKTFKTILEAYESKKAMYEQALSEARVQRGVDIQGTNPAMNRIVEQQELKKGCIQWLFNGQGFSSTTVHYNSVTDDWTTESAQGPGMQTDCTAIQEAERVKFIEQGFEWNLMTYTFYPYFWGNKKRWRKLYQLNDTDPLFLNFLQAGMARVLVPVRPGFEKQIMYFLRTGSIWQGSEVPGINSPLYLSIVEEMKTPVGTVEGEPWEVRVPTSLTVLQAESGAVEGKGLPCDCDPDGGFGSTTGGLLTGKA